MSRRAAVKAEEAAAAPDLGSVEAWRKFLESVGINVANIEATLAAYAAAHPEAAGATELARRLLADAMGADTINAIAERAATVLAGAIQSGHGEVDKKVHHTDFA